MLDVMMMGDMGKGMCWMVTTGVVVVLSCAGCQTSSLKSEVVGLPAVVKRGEKVSFTVRLKNRSFKEQTLPTEYEVRYCTGFRFIPGKKASEYRWGEDGISRNSLDVCPPTRESIAARGTREYAFEWVVPKGARGEGGAGRGGIRD